MSAADQIRAFAQLTQKQVKSAAARALNRTAQSMRAEVARAVQAELGGLKIGDIKSRISLDLASAREDLATMSADLVASGKGIPLVMYQALARNVRTPRGKRIGVTVRVKGERKLVQHAFLVETKGGYVGVFQRTGDSRFPLRQLYSTTIADIFRNQSFLDPMRAQANETLEANLQHELEYQLSKASTS